MMGWPKDGASDSRTVRGTTVRYTRGPKYSRTSASTWSASLVRASYMVSTIPRTSSDELRLACTRATLRSNWPSPSSA